MSQNAAPSKINVFRYSTECNFDRVYIRASSILSGFLSIRYDKSSRYVWGRQSPDGDAAMNIFNKFRAADKLWPSSLELVKRVRATHKKKKCCEMFYREIYANLSCGKK